MVEPDALARRLLEVAISGAVVLRASRVLVRRLHVKLRLANRFTYLSELHCTVLRDHENKRQR